MAMIKEIRAKLLLSDVGQPDRLYGRRYNMNLYRGCQHRCIYCDSRSECYRIQNFDGEVLAKTNAIELLKKELARKFVRGTIGTGSMNDPYQPAEARLNLVGQALAVIADAGFPVHIITKSDMVLKDLDTLCRINEQYAAVSFTITTADDGLGKQVEPGAPAVSARLKAMRVLADHGIYTGVTMVPILPFIEDDEENIEGIVRKAHEHGAAYIIPVFGVTLRDRQRVYFYDRLDESFPGLRARYQEAYGWRYYCAAPNTSGLSRCFAELCHEYDIANRMRWFTPERITQPSLF